MKYTIESFEMAETMIKATVFYTKKPILEKQSILERVLF